jgi:hypothetical protein
MTSQTIVLNEFLDYREHVHSDSNMFLIGLAKYFNEYVMENALDWKYPTGIEGCLEYLENNKEDYSITFYAEGEEVVGFDLVPPDDDKF